MLKLLILIHVVSNDCFAGVLIGTVKSRFPEVPQKGVLVRCYDHDMVSSDDFIGEAVTNSTGQFAIKATKVSYDMFGNDADLYCTADRYGLVVPTWTPVQDDVHMDRDVINIGLIHVYPKRRIAGCRMNGCGPIVNGRDWGNLVPDFSFTEACNHHDCCYNVCFDDGLDKENFAEACNHHDCCYDVCFDDGLDKENFAEACNHHDCCYDVCFDDGLDKEKCDREVYELMKIECDRNGHAVVLCKAVARFYFKLVRDHVPLQHWCNKQCKESCNLTISQCSCDQ